MYNSFGAGWLRTLRAMVCNLGGRSQANKTTDRLPFADWRRPILSVTIADIPVSTPAYYSTS
jgi:hypothetical protein